MAIFSNRINHALRAAALVIMCAFTKIPAEVSAAGRTCFKEINFFPLASPHIAYIQITSQAIKRYAPGITQAIMPDFIPKWIISRDGIRLSRVDIQPEYLAKKNTCVLCIAKRIALRAPIPKTGVEITIGAKYHHTPIVICEWLIYP